MAIFLKNIIHLLLRESSSSISINTEFVPFKFIVNGKSATLPCLRTIVKI